MKFDWDPVLILVILCPSCIGLPRRFSTFHGATRLIYGPLDLQYVLPPHLPSADADWFQAWDLLQGRTLFTASKEDGSFSDGVHLSEFIAALGPPPPDFLAQNRERALQYWDEKGIWGEFVPIPVERTLEMAESKLDDKTKFPQFMRRALAWDPRERPTARELLEDPWLLE